MPDELLSTLRLNPRLRLRNDLPLRREGKVVLYWMQRSQRARGNEAFNTAVLLANTLGLPLIVLFRLKPDFPGATERHFAFLLEGLAETAREAEERGATFLLRFGEAGDVAGVAREVNAAVVVGDENPLREPEAWRAEAAAALEVAFVTVDADVIVPSSLFEKEEYAARTLRPKIMSELERFLVPVADPEVEHRLPGPERPAGDQLDPDGLLARLSPDTSSRRLLGVQAGTEAGLAELDDFITRRLSRYDVRRRHPEYPEGTSRLSPWLHFGQLGPLQIALQVVAADVGEDAREAFLEELVVRRELAVNFVVHNPDYDRFAGLPSWGLTTLAEHAGDPRPHLYSREEFESGQTHDPLWNAAQKEMMHTGFMHGYMRMYWAKKILHWSRTPEEAYETAVILNDRWSLDGRDPSGYSNIAWAIGGRHDRPWPEREVFGKVRSMTYKSTSRKFDSAAYVARIEALTD